MSRAVWGISVNEAQDLKTLKYWPIPNQMLNGNDLSEKNKTFLNYVNDWMYKELSADSHMTTTAIVLRLAPLLLNSLEHREERLNKIKSDTMFTAITLVLAITTEIYTACGFGQNEKFLFLWGILSQCWREAKEIFTRRYQELLPLNTADT